jgi:hypothetical protein
MLPKNIPLPASSYSNVAALSAPGWPARRRQIQPRAPGPRGHAACSPLSLPHVHCVPILHVHAACPCCMSMLHVHLHVHASCLCFMFKLYAPTELSMLHALAAFPCFMSMMQIHAAFTFCIYNLCV